MKGIILAGGHGTRLHPLTLAVSKQLMPVYDKPMIYYPLTTLMFGGAAGDPDHHDPARIRPALSRVLGDGSQFGLRCPTPRSRIQAAWRRPSSSAASSSAATAWRWRSATTSSTAAASPTTCARRPPASAGATVFAYRVKDPERYGVVEFDADGRALSLEEKPAQPAIVLRGHRSLLLRQRGRRTSPPNLKPSAAGRAGDHRRQSRVPPRGALHVETLGRGIAWLDTGTHDALLQASNFIQAIEERQGLKVACPEEVAYRMGYITRRRRAPRAPAAWRRTSTGEYLRQMVEEDGASVASVKG